MLIRMIDVVLSIVGLVVGAPLLILICIIGYFDTGSPVFCQQRIGKGKRKFVLVKFRTMKVGSASVASHLADASLITPLGRFLRRTKIDEVPQLWNVLKGDMSLVGPRPCLPNQFELINEREKRGVFTVKPGITGLAQINCIDMSTPILLAETDEEMIESLNIITYFFYILQTVVGRGAGDRVRK